MPAPNTMLKAALIALPPAAAYFVLGSLYPYMTTQLAQFALFFLGFLVLPALAIGLWLPLGERSWTESLFLGYPPAQVVYFLFVFCGARFGQPYAALALPVLAVVVVGLSLRKSEGRLGAPTLPTSTLLLILGVLVPALALCFFKFTSLSFPTPGNPMDYYHDDVGTAAFVWSAVSSIETGGPYMLPFVAGFQYPYHVIYHYSYAFPCFALGIPPMEQILFLWPPLHWTMLAGAAVVGLRRLAGLSVLETALAVLFILFSDGLDFYAMPSLQTLAYFHTFWFGLPAFLLLLATIYGYLSGRRSQISATHAACCYFVAAGTKANLLPFLPIALLPVFVYRLYKRVSVKKDCLLALGFIVAAVLLFFTHYQSLGTGQAQFKAFKPWSLFMGTLSNLLTMAMVAGPFALVGLLAADRDQVLRRKLRQDRQYHLFLFTFCLASAVFLKTVNYVGGDFYFYWQIRIITLVGFAALAGHALKWRTALVAPVVVLVLVAGLWQFGSNRYALTRPVENWRAADENAKNVDADEVEGLRWASTHLNRTRPMFTNKDKFLGNYLGGYMQVDLFDYLGFSGMQGYAWVGESLSQQTKAVAQARHARINDFLNAKTPAEREAALAHIGADYYFHCERLRPSDFSGVAGLRQVFRNPSLTIYELTGPKDAASQQTP